MLTVLSLGAGVQSSTILHMILNKVLPLVDGVIYLDAGWEPNYTRVYADYLRRLCDKQNIPFFYTAGPSIQTDLKTVIAERQTAAKYKHLSIPLFTLDQDGRRGQLPRRCTREFRLLPLFKALRQTVILPDRQNGYPKPWIKMLLGISTDEPHRAKPSREKWKENAFPLLDGGFSRNHCRTYLSYHQLQIPHRSSCTCCPYRSNHEWNILKTLDPTNWEAACDLDEAVRDLGRPGTQLFLHASRTPLSLAPIGGNPIPIMA